MNSIIKTSALTISLIASNIAIASNHTVESLGTTLTPLGAELAGNKEGTIPAWSGGLTSKNTPKSKDAGRPDNPFPEDKPLFTITNQNLQQYEENLSAGQIAMFKKHADYKMPVYETKRTAAYDESLYKIVKSNVGNAKLIQDGNGLQDFDTTIPFPLANSAMEVLWNHMTRYRGGSAKRFLTTIPVQSDGRFVEVKMSDELVWPEFLVGGRDEKKDDNVLFYAGNTPQ